MAANQIHIPYNGVTYTLEYSRDSIRKMEARGFRVSELGDMLATQLPLLFYGAFFMHHGGIRQELTDQILIAQRNKKGLFDTLIEMYQAPLNALLIDDPEGDEGNATWEAT